MIFKEFIEQRYTTKVYDPSGELSVETLSQLKEILRLSPSSINSQPWHFTFVESREARLELAEFSLFNAEKVQNCAAVVVFSAQSSGEQFEKWLQENGNEHTLNYYTSMVKSAGDAAIQRWLVSQNYLALGVLLSACAVMGIDATPMEGIETEKYDNYLKIENHRTLFAVALGKRAADDFNQPSLRPKVRRPMEEVVTTI